MFCIWKECGFIMYVPEVVLCTTPKAGLHPKKVMLSICWEWKGVLYFELLPPNQTINTEVYCEEFENLKMTVQKKNCPELANQSGTVFYHNNARPRTSLRTQDKWRGLDWGVLSHSPYSPDLAPSDYYPFRSLNNYSAGKSFDSLEGKKSSPVFEKWIVNLAKSG